MSDTNTKQYINGVWIEQKTFNDGGTILKLSVLPDRFIESLKAAKVNDKGYIKLVISERREVGKNGETHTCYVDDWKPSGVPTSKSPVVPNKVKPTNKVVVPVEQEEELI